MTTRHSQFHERLEEWPNYEDDEVSLADSSFTNVFVLQETSARPQVRESSKKSTFLQDRNYSSTLLKAKAPVKSSKKKPFKIPDNMKKVKLTLNKENYMGVDISTP
jgi:hypothetical protein